MAAIDSTGHGKATGALDWGVSGRPMTGQSVSGDLHLVQPFDHSVLVAVLDGVGHGNEATAAACAAVDVLSAHSTDAAVALIQRCHEALKQTRGVVLTIAIINTVDDTMTWLGVGNVEGRLLRADSRTGQSRQSVMLRGGLVGYQLPALQASILSVTRGDLLIFATDGVRAEFDRGINMTETPGQIADKILSHNFKGNDDALVLVARYLGGCHE